MKRARFLVLICLAAWMETPLTGQLVWRGPFPWPVPTPAEEPAKPGSADLANQPSGFIIACTPPALDLAIWDFWWGFNQEALLALDSSIIPDTDLARLREEWNEPVREGLRRAICDENPDVRGASAVALARMSPDSDSYSALLGLLDDPSPSVRDAAVLALGLSGDLRACSVLFQMAGGDRVGRPLADEQGTVLARRRAFAACGLAQLARSIPNRHFRTGIARFLLRELGPGGAPSTDSQLACLIGLGVLPLEDPRWLVRELLLILLDEEADPRVRAHCPAVMAKLLDGSNHRAWSERVAHDLLTLAAMSPGVAEEIRQSCFQALGRLAPSCGSKTRGEIAKVCMARMQEGGWDDAQSIHFALITLGEFVAVSPVDDPVRATALRFLMEQTRRGATGNRSWAALSLGRAAWMLRRSGSAPLPAEVAYTILGRFGKERDPAKKPAFALALALADERAAATAIAAEMKKSRHPPFRGYCALALGLLGAEEYRGDIVEMLRTSFRQPSVMRSAALALGLLGGEGAGEVLLGVLAPVGPRAPWLETRAAAAQALGTLRDGGTISSLLAILADDQEHYSLSRAYAAGALGLMLDRMGTSWSIPFTDCLNYRALPSPLLDLERFDGVLQRL